MAEGLAVVGGLGDKFAYLALGEEVGGFGPVGMNDVEVRSEGFGEEAGPAEDALGGRREIEGTEDLPGRECGHGVKPPEPPMDSRQALIGIDAILREFVTAGRPAWAVFGFFRGAAGQRCAYPRRAISVQMVCSGGIVLL